MATNLEAIVSTREHHCGHPDVRRDGDEGIPAKRRRGVLLVLPATIALAAGLPAGLAGAVAPTPMQPNGIQRLSARQALDLAHSTLAAESDIELSGELTEQGTRIDLGLRSAEHGKRAAGTLVSHGAAAGFVGILHFVSIGRVDYLDGGRSFWVASMAGQKGLTTAQRAALVKRLAGTWIMLTGKTARSFTVGLRTLTSPATLASELTTADGTLRTGIPKVVQAVRALPIISSRGGTLWLALTGKPLPVEVTAPATTGTGGHVDFSYPAAITITAPPGAKTLAQLGL